MNVTNIMLVNRTKQNKRATIEDISSITLPELSKYFDVPIAEASRHLNVGQTVLKRKCREFGIPRWPHRKIKSLDTLIQDLQVVVEERRGQDESAAAAEKQRLLEMEKQSIKKDPVMDLQSETKRFRQDIFKRRYRLKALGQQSTEEAAMGDDLLYFVRSVNPTTAAKREDA
ncbi:unnamed protein product [Spirodela intermedia]|uniref:RWP-RK domain-containing protein n=1 Tax=Spirodela intermedia TaxID=51605 RepID=A0A7I8IDK5_SPIIN|nr:unnamed protein product [Spirodela intermedia]CAA6655860.1 unnamed protein product [Spirodela intermedia]